MRRSFNSKREAGVAVFAAAVLLFLAATAGAAPVSPPTSLTATAVSSSQINLTWVDTNPNETGYSVERSLSSTSGFAQIASLGVNATSYSNTGLAAGTTYYYRVRSAKNGAYSTYSNVASARTTSTTGSVPAAPSTLAAGTVSSTQITLSWRDNSTNETAFRVERAPASAGPWTYIGSTSLTGYGDSGLAAGTLYYYRVAAYNSYGTSAYSNTASATTQAATGVPSVPGSLTATSVSSSQINLVWVDASGNETGFKIERSTSTSPWAQIGTTGTNVASYASTGLAASTTYSYRVRANNASGDSAYSNTASAVTQSGGGGGSVWSKWYGGSGEDSGKSVAVDSTGNVAVAGNFQGIVNFGTGALTSYTVPLSGPTQDAFVAKYSPSGGALWSRGMGGDNSDAATGVAVDSSGNVAVTGYQMSTSADYGGGLMGNRGGTDIFVAKYAGASGGYLWGKTIGGTGYDSGTGVAIDGSGNVYVAGYMDVSASGVDFGGGALLSAGMRDAFLVKYTSTGAHVWSKRFGSTGQDSASSVAVDSTGNVFVTGTFNGSINLGGTTLTSAGGVDIFVAKFSATGAHLWSKSFGGTSTDAVRGMAVDGAGDVVLTGQFLNSISFGGTALTSAGFEDIFLAKLSGAAGAHLWSKRFGSTSTTDAGYGVAVDSSGNVAMTGFYGPSADFGGGIIIAQGYDIFVAKYNSAGGYISARRYGDPAGLYDGQFGDAIAMSGGGSIYVTGHFVGTLTFGAGGQATSTLYGGNDGFLSSIGP